MSKYIGDVSAYAYAVSKGYTGTEEEFAELMASYADVGQTAVDAKDAAVAAKTAAQTAATTATNKASEATTSAQTATTKAGEASTSASTATSAKDTAVSASQVATSKASEAAQSATSANTAKTEALTAKTAAQAAQTAAETAQGKAETAQGAAEDAAESVSASAAQIATNTSDISDLKEDITSLENGKANVDGYYEDLVSGGSTQLLSDMVETDTTPYNYRTAGGSLEIGDRMRVKEYDGLSLPINQLASDLGVLTSSGSRAFTSGTTKVEGHKYWLSAKISDDGSTVGLYSKANDVSTNEIILAYSQQTAIFSAKTTATSDGTNANSNGNMWLYVYIASGNVSDIMLIDLTLLLGTTIADYVYTLESGTAGTGLAWLKKYFPKIFDAGYIPYNAGSMQHVTGLSASKTVGFNQWDEEWESGIYDTTTGAKTTGTQIRCKNLIPVLPNTTYYFNTSGVNNRILFYDANENYLGVNSLVNNKTFLTPMSAFFMAFHVGGTYGSTYKNNLCINLHWDGERDGEYEPYEEHTYALPSDEVYRGNLKIDANGVPYAYGDRKTPDGNINRIFAEVDLGTLNWGKSGTDSKGFTTINFYGAKGGAWSTVIFNGSCAMYVPALGTRVYTLENDKTCGMDANGKLYIYDSAKEGLTVEQFKTAMSGVYLVYELATPTTEEGTPYTEEQITNNWGTEELVSTTLVPVGHVTDYHPDLRAKVEVAPESPDTDGLYLMKRENGENSYVAYLGELPSDPTTDGTYTLKCTVASGVATKTWEADT